MNKLEYDLRYVTGHLPQGGSLEVDVTEKSVPKEEPVDAIEFSKNLLDLLEDKLKAHNSEFSKRVRLDQLRKAFCRGAGMFSDDPEWTITEWGLARVNLFLRISAGKIENINLDISKNVSYNKLVDITDHFVPCQEDFEKAKSEKESRDLNYHFDNVDELYIDNDPDSGFYLNY
jgi:hypothetical protein